jgi:ABC-type sugar transport system permease subunit
MTSTVGSARLGYACAQGIVFGLILLTVSLVQMQVSRRAEAR